MIQDDDMEQEMLDKALCFVCHRQMVDGNCPVCDDPETYKENAMTPEQIEKERVAFEAWIHPKENDPEDLLEWSDCGGYLYGRIRDYWRAWIARANQSAWISVEERLPEPLKANEYRTNKNALLLYAGEDGDLWETLLGWYTPNNGFEVEGSGAHDSYIITHWQPLPTPPKGKEHAKI